MSTHVTPSHLRPFMLCRRGWLGDKHNRLVRQGYSESYIDRVLPPLSLGELVSSSRCFSILSEVGVRSVPSGAPTSSWLHDEG